MPASKKPQTTFKELEIALLWGAWVELGVSGWEKTHRDWAVDPEPLILRTAELADSEPRLRDEALDWSIHFWRYVSKVRLRNLLKERSGRALDDWGRFAATVNEHSGAHWPRAGEPFAYQITGRSTLASMKQPSRAWLRLRAAFGVGARAEILRFFLSGTSRASTALITAELGYAKSNVMAECESLEKAGVLRRGRIGNRYFYSLMHPDALAEFVGEIAPVRPSWTALLEVTSSLVQLETRAAESPQRVLSVEAHRTYRRLDGLLDRLDIEARPALARPDGYWTDLHSFAEPYLSAWASGRWDPKRPPTTIARRTHER
ncbi:hypothetical protein OG474_26385 [Kribbella sp. NBC_01505]|uniref:hypothetical protein n=1 Tax=Kribbella sp. NBC_01505 TaxID=2903580 RepID=UPI00386F5321